MVWLVLDRGTDGRFRVNIEDAETGHRLLGPKYSEAAGMCCVSARKLNAHDAKAVRKYLDAAFPEEQKPGISIATDEAAQMLKAGWTIEHHGPIDKIFWRRPDGVSGSDYMSDDLYPPAHAVSEAIRLGHIQPVVRRAT